MKRVMMSTMMCMLMTVSVSMFAQSNDGQLKEVDHAERKAMRLKKEVQLTDAQYEKVYKLFQKEQKELQKILTEDQLKQLKSREPHSVQKCKPEHGPRDMQLRMNKEAGIPRGEMRAPHGERQIKK